MKKEEFLATLAPKFSDLSCDQFRRQERILASALTKNLPDLEIGGDESITVPLKDGQVVISPAVISRIFDLMDAGQLDQIDEALSQGVQLTGCVPSA